MENPLKNIVRDEPAPKEEPKPSKPSRLKKIHDYDFSITKENAPRIIPFVLFLTFWAVVSIANHHYGERTVHQIDVTQKEMKELKADYYTINAELSNKSMESQVVKAVEPIGLKELTKPPMRLKISKDER